MSGRILVGTTSWSEKTLVEESDFYPEDAKTPEARLRYYASRFPITEVDSTYYGLPREHNAELWAERTPEGFVFDVKAFRLFTFHRTPVKALPVDLREALGETEPNVYYEDVPEEIRAELWRRFRSALEPLADSGRLGAVLLQFAPWFVFRRTHLDHVAHCAEQLSGFRVAVEMRNKSWLGEKHRDEALAFEREHGLANVVVDEPQTGNSVPAVWEATTDELAIVRLHGRNVETWSQKDLPSAAARFGYLYSDEELHELVPPVRALARKTKEVHVLFNNCHRDNAQTNAAALRRMLHV